MSDTAQCLNGPVKAGDVVRVVLPAPCCGSDASIGLVFRVRDVDCNGNAYYCNTCGHDGIGAQVECNRLQWLESCRLIRLDPPATPESVQRDEEVTA